METLFDIPRANDHQDNARRAFEQFFVSYQPMLKQAEDYLDEVIEKTDPIYGVAYVPWKNALHDLLTGAYLIIKKIPLPDKEAFMDALCMFSFDSTIEFLRDLFTLCQLQLKKDWEKEFREHIDRLLFAISTINQQHQYATVPVR